MKTIFLLSALAAAALAAPAQLSPGLGPIGEELSENIKREKKSPTFGSQVGHVPVALVPVQHSVGHPGLGHGGYVQHRPHYFRDSDVNGQPRETEAIPSTRSAEIREGKSDMEKSLMLARTAVDDLEKDMIKIEGNQHARMQWKNTDAESDLALHENIQKAKEALDVARKSFSDLESQKNLRAAQNTPAPQQQDPAATGVVQTFMKPVSHEMKPEKQRQAKWMGHIDSIHTNERNVVADERAAQPVQEEAVFQTKDVHEMESSASTNKDILFAKMDNNQWKHNSQDIKMKSAEGFPMESKNLETTFRASESHPETLSPTTVNFHNSAPMATTHEISPNHQQRMSPLKDDFGTLHSNMRAVSPLAQSMKVTEEKESMFKTKNAQDIEASASSNHKAIEKMDMKWHQDLPTMKSADLISEIEHERASSKIEHSDLNKGHYMKPFESGSDVKATKPKEIIQTTELRSNFDVKDMDSQKQHELMTAQLRNDLSIPMMKAAESNQHGMTHMQTLQVPHSHDLPLEHQNGHLNKFHHQQGQQSGQGKDSFHLHASAKSSDHFGMPHHEIPNMEHAKGKSAEGDFMRQAMAEQQWKNMHQSASARSYDAVYGGGAVVGAGASSGAAVGVFPNAQVGGCALPLLLSCSPSVVSGRLAHTAHGSYAAPAVGASVYAPAAVSSAAYKSVDHLNLNKKRDTNKLNKDKVIKKTVNPNLQKTKIIQSYY